MICLPEKRRNNIQNNSNSVKQHIEMAITKYYRKYFIHVMSVFLTLCAAFVTFSTVGCLDTAVKEPGNRVYQIDYDKCPACGLCVRPCPENAISEHEIEGKWIVIIDPDKCNGCGECVPYCDFDAFIKEWKP